MNLTKNELPLIHEAVCMASQNKKAFETFLKRNDNSKALIKAWRAGWMSACSHRLVGYCFDKCKND